MMQHSVMLKKIGTGVVVFGLLVVVIMAILFAFLQQFAIAWSYFITVGFYFVVAGIIVWVGGMAKQSMEEKDALEAQREAKREAQQIEADVNGIREKI
jgi:hypothetical protein